MQQTTLFCLPASWVTREENQSRRSAAAVPPSRSPFQVTGAQGRRVGNMPLNHQPTSETGKGLCPPSLPTSDRPAHVNDCALPSHDNDAERLALCKAPRVTAEPAPREGGCWSWRTQKKRALELPPPHLAPSKMQWMINSFSIGFCPQGWSCNPFCKDLVRMEGCPWAVFLSTSGRYCFPPLLVHPPPFRESLTLLAHCHFPGLSVTNTSKPRTCLSSTLLLLLLPTRPLRTAR